MHKPLIFLKMQIKLITAYSNLCSVILCVENVGVSALGNNLWHQAEFIEMALRIPNPILVNVGRVNANDWNIEEIIRALKDKIIAYHLTSFVRVKL